MTARAAAFCLALALSQESDVVRLAEQLGNEDPTLRQQAERRLLEIGEPARPELERLSRSKDAEASGRARSILAAFDRTAFRRKYLGPAWTVTLPEGDYLLGDLPGLLKPQVPAPLQVPSPLAGARVRIGAKEMPVLAFLDRVCDAHGGITVPFERPDGAFALAEGKPVRRPTIYSGPFRVWIERLTIEEREKWRGCRMVYGLAWQPNVDPMNDGIFTSISLQVKELTDADGKELKIEPERGPGESSFSLDRSRKGVWRGYVDLAAPPAAVRKWGRMKGSVKMEFPSKVVPVEFKAPLYAAGKTVQAGAVVITLKECRRTDTGIEASIFFRRTWKEEDATVERDRLELRARYQEESIVIRTEGGATAAFDCRMSSHSSSSEEETQEIKGFFQTKDEPRTLSFPFVADTFEHEVPFEFTDVDVP